MAIEAAQLVHERVLKKAPTGHRWQAGRFRYDQYSAVVVENGKLKGNVGFRPGCAVVLKALAHNEHGTDVTRSAIQTHPPLADVRTPPLKVRVFVSSAEVVVHAPPGAAAIDQLPIDVPVVQALLQVRGP